MDEIDNSLIKECFNGNAQLYASALKDGRSEVIHWSDIKLSAEFLPDLENLTLHIVKERLGFLPERYKTLPHEPFLRNILHQYHNGMIDFDTFLNETDAQLKLIKPC